MNTFVVDITDIFQHNVASVHVCVASVHVCVTSVHVCVTALPHSVTVLNSSAPPVSEGRWASPGQPHASK